jgi:hypothetical protein
MGKARDSVRRTSNYICHDGYDSWHSPTRHRLSMEKDYIFKNHTSRDEIYMVYIYDYYQPMSRRPITHMNHDTIVLGLQKLALRTSVAVSLSRIEFRISFRRWGYEIRSA